jgi:hypothetical protein
MAQYPLVNGKRYDFSSITLQLPNGKMLGFKEVTYSVKLEPGEVRGAHPQILGRTRGNYTAEGSLTVFRQEADEIRTALGDGYMEKEFDITVTYGEDGQPTVTDILKACRIVNDDASRSQGQDPLEEKLDLSILSVRKNGKHALKKPIY